MKIPPLAGFQLAPTFVIVVTLGIVLGIHCCGGTPLLPVSPEAVASVVTFSLPGAAL